MEWEFLFRKVLFLLFLFLYSGRFTAYKTNNLPATGILTEHSNVEICVKILTIFSSLAGGLRRKKQSGANRMSTTPMMVISHGKPILRAMAPPADGPAPQNTHNVFHVITFPYTERLIPPTPHSQHSRAKVFIH